MKIRQFIILITALSIFAGCKTTPYRRASGAIWATTYNITYSSPVDLSDSIVAVMRRVEKSLSPFDSASLISRVNRGEDVAVDSLIARIFRSSQLINARSHGAFDPTVAPLINLWGFGYRDGSSDGPSQQQIDSALRLVGIDKCRLMADRIVKPAAATEFNFSAITKGYGCDLIGEMFRRNGVDNYMIEIGGEIALGGVNPEGELWHIQIDSPDAGMAHSALTVVQLSDCGIATSGNYRNYRQTKRGRVWHTIDPKSGRPAVSDVVSATVIAPTCMEADALATACMAMPSDSAMKMITGIEAVEVLLVVDNGVDRFAVVRSEGFPK